MTYDLCKKLKDAGFPQEPFWVSDAVVVWGGSWYWAAVAPDACYQRVFLDPDGYAKTPDPRYGGPNELVKDPLLAELIEACGKGFFGLTRHANVWQTNWKNGMAGETAGAVPEEAVAYLWIAMQNK